MAYNQTAILTGNMGAEVEVIQGSKRDFASFSIATTDSYKDKNEQYIQKKTDWHKVLVFSPYLQEQVKSLKKGTRVEIIGSIAYRPFEITLEDGRTVPRQEAYIIARKLELKPLVKKQSS